MITAKEMRQTRNLAIARLHTGGISPSTIANAFSLTQKRVGDILRKPGLVEGIMRTTGREETPAPVKRLSTKEAERVFENLGIRARNRLKVFNVTSIESFRVWWKSDDADARRQHHDLIYGHGHIFWHDNKPAASEILLKSGEEMVRLAAGLGLRKVPPL